MTSRLLLLGTRNRKKLAEIADLLDLPEIELATLEAFPEAPEVEETGESFHENACLKAQALAAALGQWTLGEDSGLCVDALGGRPGIYSARYAGEPSDDERNNDKLLEELADVPLPRRGARYECWCAIADPAGAIRAHASGACPGSIALARRGTGGFGYDPLFVVESEGKTFGELPAAFKRRTSHRAAALQALRPRLASLIADGGWP